MRLYDRMLILLALAVFLGTSSAAPAPPEMLIRNSTHECMAFMAGDECTDCEIPPGWTSLGYMSRDCPEGFTEVARNYSCSPFKIPRCCSQGHSGGMGDCKTLLIDKLTMRCAFEKANCTTPGGWEKSDPSNGGAQCPENYRWADSACESPLAPGGCSAAAFIIGAVLCMLIVSNTRFNT